MMTSSAHRSCGPTILRIVVGIVFLSHGIQKLFTWGVPGVVSFMGSIGMPYPRFFGVLLPLVELFCGAALIFGFATRVNALLLAVDMAVAIVKVHFKHGFFMPMGYEFALTLLAANLCLMFTGGGSLSLDSAIWGGKEDLPARKPVPPVPPSASSSPPPSKS